MQNQEQPVHLRDYFNIMRKRIWVIITVFVIVVTIVTIGTFNTTPIYRATCRILIEKEASDKVTFSEAVGIDTTQKDYYQTQYRLIKSKSLAGETIDKLNLRKYREFTDSENIVESFLQHIEVVPIRNTRLVDIQAESESPKLAAEISNTLADMYIKQNFEKRFSKKNLGSLLSKDNSYSKIIENPDKIKDIETLPSIIKNPLIQSLKSEYSKLESKYAELSKRYKSKHPKIIEIKASMKVMKQKLEREMEKIVKGIKIELTGALKRNNIQIVDRATVPEEPIKPQKRKNIFLGLLFGIFGGTGMAFFLDYLDNTVKTKEDVTDIFEFPFLGHIPIIKPKNGKAANGTKHLHSFHDTKSVVSEAYRNLRTNIKFSSAKKDIKSILITSSFQTEGKTMTATNTAVTFAQSGEKVLLIDADLRKAIIHKIFKVPNKYGLSTYLSGEKDFNEIIKSTKINNLSIITSGKLPPNPAELLESNKIEKLINQAKKEYDRIIFDSPPVSAISDGLILSRKVDGVIFVIQYNKFSKDSIMKGKDKLKEIGANVIGAVLNNFNIKKENYGSDHYYYYSYK
ncbi:MAG: polysaccharide biosynthesis tyrosine autokinase [Atribacterota bacterium]